MIRDFGGVLVLGLRVDVTFPWEDLLLSEEDLARQSRNKEGRELFVTVSQ